MQYAREARWLNIWRRLPRIWTLGFDQLGLALQFYVQQDLLFIIFSLYECEA